MQEWRQDFECYLIQNIFTPISIMKPCDMRFGNKTVHLDPTVNEKTSGHILFKLPLSVREMWVVQEEIEKHFERIKNALISNRVFVKKMEFKELEPINPPKDATYKVRARFGASWSIRNEAVEFSNKNMQNIEKSYAMAMERKDQITKAEFVNNAHKWVFQEGSEREIFFNNWLTFNQIYNRYTDDYEAAAIRLFAKIFSQYKDSKECRDNHSRNISDLFRMMNIKSDSKDDPVVDSDCAGWDEIFSTIYCVRNCLFHENKFKTNVLLKASEILNDVVLISLNEIMKDQKPPASRSDDKCNCDDISDVPR